MKIFEDGNLSAPVRTLSLIVGIGIGAVSFYIHSLLLMSLGLVFAALGGYSSRAKTSGLKPFDNTYKKTKDSYKEDEKEKNEADQDKNNP